MYKDNDGLLAPQSDGGRPQPAASFTSALSTRLTASQRQTDSINGQQLRTPPARAAWHLHHADTQRAHCAQHLWTERLAAYCP